MNRIVLKCLKKEKEKRFRDCNALTKALQQPETTAAKPETAAAETEPEKNKVEIHTKQPPPKPATPKKDNNKTPVPTPNKNNKKFTTWKTVLFFIFLIIAIGVLYFIFHQKAIPSATYTSKVVKIDMVFVKGDTFQMGSNDGNYDDTVHTVTVSDFYIGKYEVTQKQWIAIMGNNPSHFRGDNLPVENVSWNDVQKFLKKLNQHYRLPTEAEWEYAARGGVKSRGYRYAGSNNIDKVAWYCNNSGNRTHPVGTKAPNELGLYDMSGNVWEWCSDWYDENYYKKRQQNNPQDPSKGSHRVNHGGSWVDCVRGCRTSFRGINYPGGNYINLGFRLVLLP